MKFYISPFGVIRSGGDLPCTEITEEEYNAQVVVIIKEKKTCITL